MSRGELCRDAILDLRLGSGNYKDDEIETARKRGMLPQIPRVDSPFLNVLSLTSFWTRPS